jgi:hypothetical protein
VIRDRTIPPVAAGPETTAIEDALHAVISSLTPATCLTTDALTAAEADARRGAVLPASSAPAELPI